MKVLLIDSNETSQKCVKEQLAAQWSCVVVSVSHMTTACVLLESNEFDLVLVNSDECNNHKLDESPDSVHYYQTADSRATINQIMSAHRTH